MRTLNIYDAVQLTSLMKEVSSTSTDSFTLLNSGDQVTFLPCDYGEVTTLKVYLNQERIETSTAKYLNENGISNVSIVRIIEELDEKISDRLGR